MIVTLGRFWGRKSGNTRRQSWSQRLSVSQIEQFESRLLLTGNVLVSQKGTSVSITGDDGSNEIAIIPGPLANTVTIVGLNGTLVNGTTSANASNAVKTFKINLGDGNDNLRIDDVTLPALTMNLGNGNDVLEFERHDDLGIKTTINGKANIKGGNGNDVFRFGLVDIPENFVSFKSKVTVNGGKDSDTRNVLDIGSFALSPKFTAIETVENNPVIETDVLSASLVQVLVGANEQVVFAAHLDDAPVGTAVKLYSANESGTPNVASGFLLNLFDDGSPLHQDAVAGDGIFSNTFAIILSTAGEHFYAAQVLNGLTVVDTLSTEITAVSAPTEQESQEILDDIEELNQNLFDDLDNGVSAATALNNIKNELLALDNVVANSISVTDVGIFWTTTNGETHGLLTTTGGAGTTRSSTDFGSFVADVQPRTASNVSVASVEDPQFTGNALILAPFYYQFEPSGGDESDNIQQILSDAGMDTVYFRNSTVGATTVGVADFKGLGFYDAVVITAHGANVANVGEVILTGERVTLANKMTFQADVTAGRLIDCAGFWAITPRFVSYYSGQMDDSIIYVGACEDAANGSMYRAFQSQGAAAYVGYTKVVNSDFANSRGISLFTYLTTEEENAVGDAPGINVDIDPGAPHARYVSFGDADAHLPIDGDLLRNTELYVSYTWPVTQRDLDSSTLFVGSSVGYANNGSHTYLTFSGDDTTAGGKEDIYVNLKDAYDDGAWGGSVDVDMRAGWYSPAGGSGPALLTVAFYNTETEEFSHVTQRTINPGTQSGAAATPVGTAHIIVNLHDDNPENDTVEFSLI